MTDDHGKPLPESLYEDIFDSIDSQVHFRPTDRVLEVGAGSGLILERIANRVHEAVGTDISDKMLKLIPARPNLTLRQMNSDHLEFSDGTFDKAISHNVTQYFPNLGYFKAFFREMYRVCKPGGVVFIGDIHNADLEGEFRHTESRNLGMVLKLKRIGKRFLRGDARYYLFVSPSTLHEWAKELGASSFQAVLATHQSKPLFHRQFRYNVVIRKP